MNPKTLISLSGGVISNPLRRLSAPASFELRQGECIAVVGPVGSGKSTLLKMITGGFYLREGTLRLDLGDESYRAIRFVEFDNAYSTTETQYYHQQRWQAFEREASPLAGELLGIPTGTKAEGKAGMMAEGIAEMMTEGLTGIMTEGLAKEEIENPAGKQRPDVQQITTDNPHQNTPGYIQENTDFQNNTHQGSQSWRQRLFKSLNIGPLLDKEIITLSSGELRRFSIARALLQRPEVLVLESPFIGLDPPTRQVLCNLLEQLVNTLGISIIMTLTDPDRIPPAVSHVYFMDHGRLSAKMPASQVHNAGQNHPLDIDANPSQTITLAKEFFHGAEAFNKVVEMRGINISYGERQIFRDLNWTVRSGERWNVTGPNGSGKSTLLSLVNADNPRAYSLDITLFDRRRGTGESIWDIKKHIGYLSSEMHSSYTTPDKVIDVLRGGLTDRFGGGISIGGEDAAAAEDELLMNWLDIFGATQLAGRNYLSLSSGEQRYVLLIRAFVKNPDLLILDEPFQGLDPQLRKRAAAVIEAYCAQENKTLIFVTHYIEEIPGVVTHTLQL